MGELALATLLHLEEFTCRAAASSRFAATIHLTSMHRKSFEIAPFVNIRSILA